MSKAYLIGAGPGAPDLITLRAINILKKCEVILHDLLVPAEILNYAPKNALKICVGKKKNLHLKSQIEINNLMLKYARLGKIVARLKMGTPFLFGKGFEEAEFLAKNKIKFEIVPGVSAATAVPESFNIPLTYAKEFRSIAFASGHWDNIKDIPAPNAQTIVYFMGLSNLENIILKLIDSGRDKKTPCAILSRGTFSDQQKVIGNLENILEKINNKKIKSPALFMAGEIINKYAI